MPRPEFYKNIDRFRFCCEVPGSANDIDVSKLSITGEGGITYTLTSSDVDVSSSTQFNVTLNATDQLHVGGLLNKDGSSSDGGTTYNSLRLMIGWLVQQLPLISVIRTAMGSRCRM